MELVGALPLVLLVVLVAWQLALAGHALWVCAQAARVAARAEAVSSDPLSAARSALPSSLRHGVTVRRRREGGVEVSVRVPLIAGPVKVSASSSFGDSR